MRVMLEEWTKANSSSHIELYSEVHAPHFGLTRFAICVGSEIVWFLFLNAKRNSELSVDGNSIFDARGRLRATLADPWNLVGPAHEDLAHTVVVVTNAPTVKRNRGWYKAQFRLIEVHRLVDLLDEKLFKYVHECDRSGASREAAEQCEAWGGVRLL